MSDNMTATPEQKKELTIQALEIEGFEEMPAPGIFAKQHGKAKILVDLNEKQPSAIFIIDGKRDANDDVDETLVKTNQIIVEAEDGRTPSRTTADIVVNTRAQESTPEQPGDAQTEPVPTDNVNVPAVLEAPQALTPAAPSDLSVSTIKKYINDKATDEEAYVFLQLCKARGLNPFLKEAYLIKFASLPEKQQKDVLLGMIDLPIDLDELDMKRKGIYDKRTDVNRDIKRFEGQRDGIPDMPSVPDEEESAVDVIADMQKASEQIAINERGRQLLRKYQHQSDMLFEKQANLKAELETCTADINALQPEIAQIGADVESMVDPDLEQFKCKLEDVEQINVQVRQKQGRTRLSTQINDLKVSTAILTNDIREIDGLKTKTISEAGMPVDGLG